ncbi:hypothetical protein [Thalassotalea montiporae]
MATITLTEEQRKAIKQDFENQVEMLSDEEVEVLASKINDKVNIPFVREKKEQMILVKTVKKFDRLLYKNLPNELYGLVKDSQDGISDDEAKELEATLTERLNKKFDIPYIPEIIEAKIFKLLVGFIVSAMRKNFSILHQA